MREQFSSRIREDLLKQLRELSAKKNMPMSRLLEEAIKDLLKKMDTSN